MNDSFDPIGPGTPAWEHSEAAIAAGINGRDPQPHLDAMTRELLAHGASAQTIREWEAFVDERIANPEPDDYESVH
jgi:hypothetical protein